MAQPIPLDLPPRDAREELRSRLRSAPEEHAEAVLAGYEILQALDDRGVLEMARGALGASDKVLQSVIDAAKTPEAIRALRNLLILAKLLGAIEPETLARFARSLPGTVAAMQAEPAQAPGLWSLLGRFRNQDVRRGMRLVTRALEALGRNTAR